LIVLILVVRSTKSFLGVINSENIRVYRMQTAYGSGVEGAIPGWILQLTKVSRMISLISIYILIYNKLEKKTYKTNWRLLICSVCLYLPIPLLGGARFDLIVLVLYSLMVLLILRIKRGENSNIKSIILMAIFVSLGILLFSVSRTIVGRTSDKGLIAYLSEYFGGSTVLLDDFLRNPLHASYFGEETLIGINKFLNAVGLTNNPTTWFFEFRSVNGYPIGNVYSSIRSFVYDFGFIGVPIFGFLQGVFFSVFYQIIKINNYSGISISIIFYSFISYSLFFSSFQEMFFSTMLSTNFLTFLIVLLLLKRFLIIKKGEEIISESFKL